MRKEGRVSIRVIVKKTTKESGTSVLQPFGSTEDERILQFVEQSTGAPKWSVLVTEEIFKKRTKNMLRCRYQRMIAGRIERDLVGKGLIRKNQNKCRRCGVFKKGHTCPVIVSHEFDVEEDTTGTANLLLAGLGLALADALFS